MGIVYHINKDKSITYVLWKGDVTGHDFVRHVVRLTSDPQWPSSRHLHIVDLRYAKVHCSVNEATMEEVAAYYGSFLYHIATMKAVIVTEAELERARFFARFVSHYGTTAKVFNDMNEGVRWLGIDSEEAKSAFRKLDEK
jgi:hypothetical protein